MRLYQLTHRIARQAFQVASVLALLVGRAAYSQTNTGLNIPVQGQITYLSIQPDGKLLLGGKFAAPNGKSLIRLYPDGTYDQVFNFAGSENAFSLSSIGLAVQSDGKFIVGGRDLISGSNIPLARFNSDGSLDSGFRLDPALFTNANVVIPKVSSLALQPDGKILLCYRDSSGRTIKRLNANGQLDASFNAAVQGWTESLFIQPDSKILVSGSTTNQPPISLYRLNADGSLDNTFKADIHHLIESLVVQPDGKILVGSGANMVPNSRMARLNSDGSLDTAFQSQIDHMAVVALALQADGKILVGGVGTTNTLLRLHPDGSRDSTFQAAFTNNVQVIILQPDGSFLIGSWSNQQQSFEVMRFSNTAPASQTLSLQGSAIQWLRGGTSPELWYTRFDLSTNGVDWISLGAGERVNGGWQSREFNFPAEFTIKAQGFIEGPSSEFSLSRQGVSWVVESWSGPPAISWHPTGGSISAGTAFALQVAGGGSPPLHYQWRKDGIDLSDTALVTGTRTPTLVLSNITGSDTGGYSVVISNSAGSITSRRAVLEVIDPVIYNHPVSQEVTAGDEVVLSVEAAGHLLLYQWYRDSIPVSGATSSRLVITNAAWADSGHYEVLVSNRFGTLISAGATLNVNLATVDPWNPSANFTFNKPSVSALIEQSDGKILVGGKFDQLEGQPVANIGRLKADGTLDSSFYRPLAFPQDANYYFALQPDGRILVYGSFFELAGQPRLLLGRLNSDGTLDTTFNPDIKKVDRYYGAGVSALLVQPDGKILMTGQYVLLQGSLPARLCRLNPDGSLDPSFQPPWYELGYVACMALQRDGKILVGGNGYLYRLNSDGTKDSSFQSKPDRYVSRIILLPDGKILVAGDFTSLGGQPCQYLGRLNPDGALDATFRAELNQSPLAVALQADGRILITDWGQWSAAQGKMRYMIQRLNADGSWDRRFRVFTDKPVTHLALQRDGKVLASGSFTSINGQPRRFMARLNNTETAIQTMAFDGTTITWRRGGSSPEIWRASFEYSTDGSDWIVLGDGLPVSGGWQLAPVNLPLAGILRARGFDQNSTWIVESRLNLPSNPAIFVPGQSLLFSNGRFSFLLSGQAGQKVVIEASADLRNWTPVWTNNLEDIPAYFTDPASAESSARFYRFLLKTP